ncbi:unnamed protein product, partial [Ceratitis capitata]
GKDNNRRNDKKAFGTLKGTLTDIHESGGQCNQKVNSSEKGRYDNATMKGTYQEMAVLLGRRLQTA